MATDYFIKFSTIKGESTDDKHADWIEFESFSFGASQALAGGRSSGGAASSERVEMQDFTITKKVDTASPDLFIACCKGDHIQQVDVEICRATGDKTPYLKFKFNDVMISSWTPGGMTGGDLPDETVSCNFGKMEITYDATDHATGQPGGSVVRWWDVEKNTGG